MILVTCMLHFYLCIYLSLHLSIYLSIYLSIIYHPAIYLFFVYHMDLMRRADSLEKTLMLGKTEGRKRMSTEDEVFG